MTSPPAWDDLNPHQELTIVKLAPDGREAARYPGEVVALVEPESWCVVRATWTHGPMSIDGLEFHTGDQLLEWFSPICWFNAFAVFAPDGHARGWYANVTYPSFLDFENLDDRPRLTLLWHDLYLDLIGRPDGTIVIRDKDELDASGLRDTDPALCQNIVSAADELTARFTESAIPFQLDPLSGRQES